MKNLMPIIIMAVMAMMLCMSWSNISDFKTESARQYKKYINDAQSFEEKGILIDAVKKYEAALRVKPEDYDTAVKIASLYQELGNESSYVSALEKEIKIDSSNPEPYRILIEKKMEEGDDRKTYAFLKTAEANLSASKEKPEEILKEIEEKMLEIRGKYSYLSCYAEEYFGLHYTDKGAQLAKVREGDKYGLMNDSGKIIKSYVYEDINLTSGDGLVPIKYEGEYYYMDSSGYKKIVTPRPADFLGVFGDKYAPVGIDGKYGYIDRNMQEYHFDYEYAGPFENGVAAVKKDGKWGLINTSFESKTGFVYDEILTDSYGYCAAFGVFFAKTNGKYNLYNISGGLLAEGFDDARMFASREPAAVKKNGKWGYVSIDGSMYIEPEYSDAQSFSIGLAPVEVDGKWGCIDWWKRQVIEPTFQAMLPFSSSGCAYIEKDDIPQMILVNVYN